MNSNPAELPDFASLPLIGLDEENDAPLDIVPTVPTPRPHLVREDEKPDQPKPAQRFTDWKIVTRLRNDVSEHLSREDAFDLPLEDQKAQAISLITHLIDDQERLRINQGQARWSGENAER